MVFHKLIEFVNFNLFTRGGEVKSFSVCFEIILGIFKIFGKINVNMSTYVSQVYDKILFYHDQTCHVVVWITALVLCQQQW